MMDKKVIGIDLGATNIRGAVVGGGASVGGGAAGVSGAVTACGCGAGTMRP